MHLTSSSAVTSSRALPARAERFSTAAQRWRDGLPGAEASSGRIRAWLRRSAQRLREGWRTLEAFLVEYYRVCAITARPMEATDTRSLRLRPGELLTLAEPQGRRRLEVVRGEIWLTQTPASRDLLLGPGARLDLDDAFPVVIEALQTTEIVLHPAG